MFRFERRAVPAAEETASAGEPGSDQVAPIEPSKAVVLKRPWILYPWLFAIYPIIAIYGRNVYQATVRDLVGPLELAAILTTLAWLAASFVIRDRVRGGFAAALFVLAYYQVEQLDRSIEDGLFWFSRAIWVSQSYHVGTSMALVLGGLTLALLSYLSIVRLKNAAPLTKFLNIFSFILIGFPLLTIVEAHTTKPASQVKSAPAIPLPSPTADSNRKAPPDIYYIILDGLARYDILLDRFDLDIEPFVNSLEKKGFYVARRATSNYAQTPLSLSSSLNGVYLDGLVDPNSVDLGYLGSLIRESSVITALKKQGYQTISYASGFDQTENPRADEYRSPYPYVGGFHLMVMSNTPAARFFLNPIKDDSYTMTRERTLHIFKTLPDIPRNASPTFTFAHILAPHPPFVFGRDGEDVSPHHVQYYLSDGDVYSDHYGGAQDPTAGYISLYRNEAKYLLDRVEQTVDQILQRSKTPPVIVIQGDHGSGSRLNVQNIDATDLRERMSIFNAYYLPPDVDHSALYPSITPVNSFRLIFNACFNADLPLLADRNYFSTWTFPCEFIDVTDKVVGTNSGERPPGQSGSKPN